MLIVPPEKELQTIDLKSTNAYGWSGRSPFDLYKQVREGGAGKPSHPFYSMYQPLAALRALHDPRFAEQLVPIQAPSGRAPLWTGIPSPEEAVSSVLVSCQLAVLWAILGEELQRQDLALAASKLAGFLSPIVSEQLTTLWTRESQEDDGIFLKVFQSSIGQDDEGLNWDEVPGIFQRKISIHPMADSVTDSAIAYALSRGEESAVAISGAGCQTSAGAARIEELVIPAFGPHVSPLSDGELFGVGPGENGWFCAQACADVWLKAKGTATSGGLNLSLDAVGIKPENPVAFVFYVRADQCSVGDRVFKPKSLARFQGETRTVEFWARNSKIHFSPSPGLKMEIIPLAGDKAFWGASFLLAVWLPPFPSTTQFGWSVLP